MKNYETIKCKCGHQARIVVCGVGCYIDCPYCGAGTYMCTTKEDAVRRFKEEGNTVGTANKEKVV